jgi:uncharacterized membrane protein YfcA
VALFAGGAIAGGQLGARLGRRLPSFLLRAAIVVIGIAGFSILADGSRLSIQKIDQARALGSNTRIVTPDQGVRRPAAKAAINEPEERLDARRGRYGR